MKVYTYNDKVLVNSANDKWLKEKEGPAPIVLPDNRGSNTTTGAAELAQIPSDWK